MDPGAGKDKVAKSLKRVLVSSGCSTVVDHLPHHLKVKGLSQATTAGTGRRPMVEKRFKRV